MKNVKKLVLNTLLLTVVAFVMKTVGVSFNVYITNMIGAAAIGLFQLIMTVYSTAVTFASGGVRLASMRLITNAISTGKYTKRSIIRRCFIYSLSVSVVISAVLFISADLISLKWLQGAAAATPLRILSLALPFIALSNVLNGYFTAIGKVVYYSSVQLIEQAIRIMVTIFLLSRLFDGGTERACIAIVCAMTFGEVLSLLLTYTIYRINERKNKDTKPTWGIWKALIRIAVPDALSSQMRSVLLTIEHLLIPIGFKKSGISPEKSMETYGVIHGMTLPIILYPSSILSSLSSLLIPEISACLDTGKTKRINYIIARVLHLSLLFGIGTAFIMYGFSSELSNAIYHNDSCTPYLQLLSALLPVMYLDMTVDGMLKGLDQQLSVMRYNITDSALCVVLVIILIPRYSIKGYIFVLFISEILNFFMSIKRLCEVSTVNIDIGDGIIKPLLCGFCSVNIIKIISRAFTIDTRIETAAVIAIAGILYVVFLRIFECINSEESNWIKGIFKNE